MTAEPSSSAEQSSAWPPSLARTASCSACRSRSAAAAAACGAGTDRRAWLAAGVGCAALFALVYAPWLARQLAVFGSIAPSATSGRILWLVDYDQLFSIGPPLGPADLLAQGLGPLVASRVEGLLWALGLFALLPLVVVLAPFVLIGAWVEAPRP